MSLPGTSRATSGGTRTTAFQPRADSRDKGRRVTALVKGFGCRPVVTYLRALRAGVRKPPRKEPAGVGEGFRMPARGDLSARAEGRRPR